MLFNATISLLILCLDDLSNIFFFWSNIFIAYLCWFFFFLVKLSQDTLRFKNKVGITGAGQPSYLYHCSSASGIKKVQEQCSSISVGNSPLLNSVAVGSRTFTGWRDPDPFVLPSAFSSWALSVVEVRSAATPSQLHLLIVGQRTASWTLRGVQFCHSGIPCCGI